MVFFAGVGQCGVEGKHTLNPGNDLEAVPGDTSGGSKGGLGTFDLLVHLRHAGGQGLGSLKKQVGGVDTLLNQVIEILHLRL